MTTAFELPRPAKKSARSCITIDEQFDNDTCLGDALVLNMDAVRTLWQVIPFSTLVNRVQSAENLSDSEIRLIANAAIAFINDLEDELSRQPEE